MKAASTKGLAPKPKLIIRDSERPTPGSNDVLVEVHASSVNPKDWKLNTNISSMLPKIGKLKELNLIGDDLSGVVVEVGKNVSKFKVGDEVYGMDMRLRTASCAEFAVISEAPCLSSHSLRSYSSITLNPSVITRSVIICVSSSSVMVQEAKI